MKTKTILITLIALIAVTVLIMQSCKKDGNNDPTPPIYTNGQGEIGEIGGTVKIEDASSPINGASIVIPEGALANNTAISINTAPANVYLPGDSTVQLIKFEPEGLEFKKPVQVTLPFNGLDIQKAAVYYYDNNNDIIMDMPIENIDAAKKLVNFETNHFSYYTACEYQMSMNMKILYNNQALKIGAMVYINGWNKAALGGGLFFPGLNRIPIKMTYWLNYGSTAEYVVRNAEIPLYSHFTVKLYDDDFFLPYKQKIELYVKREKAGGSFTAYVYKYNETGVIYNTDVIEYEGDKGLETWFTGKPLIFYFDDFEFNPENEYWIKTEWHMAKESDGSQSFTAKYELNNKEDKRKPRDMEHISNDNIYNNYIDSEYVEGGGNSPIVNLQTPTGPQTGNIVINYSLTGTESNYDLDVTYQSPSTGSNAATLVSTNAGTIDGSTIRNIPPGNHSFVWNSNQDYPAEHTTVMKIKMIWDATLVFETNTFEVDNSSTGNTPPTALFTVTPSSGTTTTNFAFDATGSTDNEDPTSNLQVRWDFDGNGSWDTNWDTDKTTNHQYSSENTYTAKLEVKDTEGLTDQYTRSITVSNGGGTGTFTDPRDGQTYNTVDIGSQTWMAENLNYETTNSWWYQNSSANGDVYGRLYTWEAALTACPSGWHLPSDEEWKTLEMALGMSQSEADDTGYRGTDEGGKMKETGYTHWNSPNTGATNSSGFTALPGGDRGSDGSFSYLGDLGYWWSSTETSGTNAWYRTLSYGYGQVYRYYYYKTDGRSVRCLKN